MSAAQRAANAMRSGRQSGPPAAITIATEPAQAVAMIPPPVTQPHDKPWRREKAYSVLPRPISLGRLPTRSGRKRSTKGRTAIIVTLPPASTAAAACPVSWTSEHANFPTSSARSARSGVKRPTSGNPIKSRPKAISQLKTLDSKTTACTDFARYSPIGRTGTARPSPAHAGTPAERAAIRRSPQASAAWRRGPAQRRPRRESSS